VDDGADVPVLGKYFVHESVVGDISLVERQVADELAAGASGHRGDGDR
jgi:hypothetical protein